MKRTLLVTALVLGAAPAYAAPGGWLMVGVGQTDVDFTANDVNDGSFTSAAADTGGTSFRLGVGYDLSDHIGIDASFIEGGEVASFAAVSDGSSWLYPAGPVSGTVDASGIAFGFNAYVPAGDRARFIGRAGILMWDLDATVVVSGVSGSGSEDGNDPYLGIGAEFDVAPALSLGAAFSRYALDDSDFDLLELGLRYRFAP